MKITNKHNLDESIYNTLSRVYPPVPNRYSVTDLVNPPLMRYLREKHWNELEQDASDMLWMLLGKALLPTQSTLGLRVDMWSSSV